MSVLLKCLQKANKIIVLLYLERQFMLHQIRFTSTMIQIFPFQGVDTGWIWHQAWHLFTWNHFDGSYKWTAALPKTMHTFYERYTRVAIARTLHASDIEVLKREQNLKIG